MSRYHFWEKYKIDIVKVEITGGFRTAFSCEPKYPNGFLLGVIAGHKPMKFRHFRYLTFEEEIEVIKNLLKYGKKNERYPLHDGGGQVAIYKDKSYVYDTISNGGLLGDFASFNDEFDEKDEEPIMILPSEDMLGIMEDFNKWKLVKGNLF